MAGISENMPASYNLKDGITATGKHCRKFFIKGKKHAGTFYRARAPNERTLG